MQYQLECRISSLNLKRDLGDIMPRGENSSTHHMLWSMTRSNNKEKGGVDAVKNGLWVDLLLGRHRGLLCYCCCCLAFSFSKLFETGCLLTLKINVVFISFWLLCLALWCLRSCYRCMIQLEKPGGTLQIYTGQLQWKRDTCICHIQSNVEVTVKNCKSALHLFHCTWSSN